MKSKELLALLVIIIVPLLLIGNFVYGGTPADHENELFQITDEPIEPSNPTNVVIREGATYFAPVEDNDPVAEFEGVIYWEELAGAGLSFYVNTTKVIEDEFRDFETKDPLNENEECGIDPLIQNCYNDLGDRYIIVPSGRSFEYDIRSYYEPDVIEDTGFIVIFNSQSVDFSLEIDGEPAFAKTDYYNRITLPKGAGIVSQAPIDDGFLGLSQTSDKRWVLEWEYINREMDTKHDPLMISVTYNYDPIFLAFTEQVYQNQQEQRERQEEINRLNLIRQSFAVIASLAIVLSLFSIFFAYLLAKRKFQNDLQRAQELPRREASDIENSPSLNVPVRSMFLSAMLLLPMFFGGVPLADAQLTDENIMTWDGTFDLGANQRLVENITMELPVQKDTVYVYANTSDSDLTVYGEFGNQLSYDVEDNRYVISNPGFSFSYTLERAYQLYNNSNMLVYLDRFWLEFTNPGAENPQEDPFFNVDMSYKVILPPKTFLYSASPSDLLEVGTENGRTTVFFEDKDRRMDAFHDVFETQVTFSYIGIYEALENLNSDFVQVRAQEQELESLIQVAAQEVLIFAILGIIAPLISFFVAYWVFRRRYKKMIDRAEKEQEEQIFVETPQIEALTSATDGDASQRLTDAFLGHYYRAVEFLSDLTGVDVTRIDQPQLLNIIRKEQLRIDVQLMIEVLNLGQSIQPEDSIGFDQLNDLSTLVDQMISSTTEEEF